MLLSQEKRDELATYSIATFNRDNKTYVYDDCCLCGETFELPITPSIHGGLIIPIYCTACTVKHNIIKQYYAD